MLASCCIAIGVLMNTEGGWLRLQGDSLCEATRGKFDAEPAAFPKKLALGIKT